MTDGRRFQGGGYGCVPYELEGYLLPVPGRGLDEELKDISA